MEKEYEEVKEYIVGLPSYLRVNTLAISVEEFLQIFPYDVERTAIKEVFKVVDNIKLGRTPEYKAGLIHAQSFSSCLVPLAFSSFSNKDVVLDVAAAPGSKTSHISAMMGNRGIIVANDRKSRQKALFGTLSRLGCINVAITHEDGKRLPWKEEFTKVLLDAPCTALGSHINAWKRFEGAERIAKNLSKVQKRMLLSAFDALKEGGELVYSTCTITEQENEGVIAHLLEERENVKIVDVSLPVEHSRGLSGYDFSSKVARIYPWQVQSEGFFVAKVVKT